MTTTNQKLLSFHIVEKNDRNNFLRWTYPTISVELNKFITMTSLKSNDEFICTRKHNCWIYITQSNNRFAVVILTSDFQPEKYFKLCEILTKKYDKSNDPVELVKLYLSLITTGSCSIKENGALLNLNLKTFKCNTNIKGFIQMFNLEVILLYAAILLKRRVLLCNSNKIQLINNISTLKHLVPCRNIEDYLYPTIENTKELKGLSCYIGGTANSDLVKEYHLYDIFVNMEMANIEISPKSQDLLALCKTQKDLAKFLVKLSENELTETQVFHEIAEKTENIIRFVKNLGSLALPTSSGTQIKMVTMDDLKNKNYSPALENFYFHLAVAENIMMF